MGDTVACEDLSNQVKNEWEWRIQFVRYTWALALTFSLGCLSAFRNPVTVGKREQRCLGPRPLPFSSILHKFL